MSSQTEDILNAPFRGYPDSDPLPFAAGDLLDLIRASGELRFGMISLECMLQSLFVADLLCKSEAGKPMSSAMWTFKGEGALNPGFKMSYAGKGTPVETFTDWQVSVLKKAFDWIVQSADHSSVYMSVERFFRKSFPGDIVGSLSPDECLKLFNEMKGCRVVQPEDKFVLVPKSPLSRGARPLIYRPDGAYPDKRSREHFKNVPPLFSPDEDLFGRDGR